MHLTKTSVFFTITLSLLASSGIAQLSLGSVISGGSQLNANMRDKKKQKNIEAGIADREVGGKHIMFLRVPDEKIISAAKIDIKSLQDQLDRCLEQFKAGKKIDGSNIWDFINIIRAKDGSWPVHYYDNEWTVYDSHNKQLAQNEQQAKDSLMRLAELEERRLSDSISTAKQIAIENNRKRLQAEKDSIQLASISQGYHFVNRPFIQLKEKPVATSTDIGKLFLGTYVRIIDDITSKEYVKVTVEDGLEGFIANTDLVGRIDSVNATAGELSRFRSAHYYKFEESDAYRAKREAAEAKERLAGARAEAAAAKREAAEEAAYRRANPGPTYYTGPKGGCYYMSGGKKVYVDRSNCR